MTPLAQPREYTFIIYNDGVSIRNPSMETIRTGQSDTVDDEDRSSTSRMIEGGDVEKKWIKVKPERLRRLCRKSRKLRGLVESDPLSKTILQPKTEVGIHQHALLYVIKRLSYPNRTQNLENNGQTSLEALYSVSNTIWHYQCAVEPFRDHTIIAFVFGDDFDEMLKDEVTRLVWGPERDLQCSIPELKEWIIERREETREKIYTIVQERLSRIWMTQPKMNKEIYEYFNNQSGSNIDFHLSWKTHRQMGHSVTNLPPRSLARQVLAGLRQMIGVGQGQVASNPPGYQRSNTSMSTTVLPLGQPQTLTLPREGVPSAFAAASRKLFRGNRSQHVKVSTKDEYHQMITACDSDIEEAKDLSIQDLIDIRNNMQKEWTRIEETVTDESSSEPSRYSMEEG